MRLNLILGVAVIALAGCVGPTGSIESKHGYDLDVETGVFGFKLEGTPTILQQGETALHSEYGADGSAKDMPSTYAIRPDGTVKATGLAATWLARAAYCRTVECSP